MFRDLVRDQVDLLCVIPGLGPGRSVVCFPLSGIRKICYVLSLVWDRGYLLCVTPDLGSRRFAITLVRDQEEHVCYEFILGLGPRREDEFILGLGPRRVDMISLVKDQDEIAPDWVRVDDV